MSELPPSFFPSFDGFHAAKSIGLGQGVEIVVGHFLGLGSVTESRPNIWKRNGCPKLTQITFPNQQRNSDHI